MKYKVGQHYLVDVAIFDEVIRIPLDEEEVWKDLESMPSNKKIIYHREYPIYNFPHDDIESNQTNIHYHIDTRFIEHFGSPRIEMTDSISNFRIEKRLMLCKYDKDWGAAPSDTIKKYVSKLKTDKMNNFKCLHKGYDLSNVEAKDGVIVCPLHSLKYCKHSHKLIKDELESI